jgi:hypothetical protein
VQNRVYVAEKRCAFVTNGGKVLFAKGSRVCLGRVFSVSTRFLPTPPANFAAPKNKSYINNLIAPKRRVAKPLKATIALKSSADGETCVN